MKTQQIFNGVAVHIQLLPGMNMDCLCLCEDTTDQAQFEEIPVYIACRVPFASNRFKLSGQRTVWWATSPLSYGVVSASLSA